MRRQALALCAAVVQVSAAAGLSIAEGANGTTAAPGASAHHESHSDSWGTGDGGQSADRAAAPLTLFSGVGSRALIGNDATDDAADQPEMATGVDLKGAPVRFPADQTPE